MRVPVTTIAFELLGFAGWPVAVVICPVTQLPFVDTVPGGHGGGLAWSGSGVGWFGWVAANAGVAASATIEAVDRINGVNRRMARESPRNSVGLIPADGAGTGRKMEPAN